ncbi:glutathione S-transferase family protein [Ramlibacter sp. AW1]|uniref:Glutathione S-transferase family protein n=1 Tax=Ramlibacter aurantiacus TaxID=2801330 RepID=A0A936ZJK2_9BURK|nr:glutathione S-transferase family protein [Ramlibacter aurantiacus]MBL0421007.1 glutathione S-transferase family protein [Ramlibacter aurantiacus]
MTAPFTLFHGVGACSRTQLILLEQAGADYELRVLRMHEGEHKTEEYLRLNPKGKVPLLVHEGRPLTENVAIATYLARLFPQAQLMPAVEDAWAWSQAVSWLSYVATGLHPTIGRARLPMKFADGEEAQASVKARGLADLYDLLKVADDRLRTQPWLAAGHFTAPDAYLFWATGRSVDCGVDLSRVPAVQAHHKRVAEMPATMRALDKEAKAAG